MAVHNLLFSHDFNGWPYNRQALTCCRDNFIVTLGPKGGAPCIFGTSGNLCVRFSLNGRSSKLNFNDAQLMTVFEPENKMVVINRKKV